MNSNIFQASILLAAFLISLSAFAGSELYRYINEKGVQVINDSIPPEFVTNGYDVINVDGSLIKRVPRQLTEDELRFRNTDESRARMKEEEAVRMRAWDESLLLRYSDIADIEAAQNRAERDLKIRISILKSNLTSIKSQIEREQRKAADIERNGREVPVELSKNIDTLRMEIEDTEQSIQVRNEEIANVKASYQRDIDRFTKLLDRVEMRRQQSQPAPSKQRKYY
ncbi:hypothetical protein [Oceanicoccus sp. KOV_DT_Chl]|uniref:hypothetical protein n=1 Tax=Oceanicoccus sp. KOV_DT_Chl TaxID=1904639 RepID=UPI000C7D50BD|nr:hypothetical protein [Oceanicoccus sp. KOV_DT_Chl]